MSVLRNLADASQERELEKVNVFYLQKEAEVSRVTCAASKMPAPHDTYPSTAQDPPENFVGQEKGIAVSSGSIKKLNKICNAARGLPAVCQRP